MTQRADSQATSDVSPRLRRMAIGAEVLPGGTHFRVWAPRCQQLQLVLQPQQPHECVVELRREADGYFSAQADAPAGTRYAYRVNGSLLADPASRFQPDGPEGPSQVVDPNVFSWTDQRWPGASMRGQVLYEMHVGTFTPEGTWQAAARELPELADLGITLLEIMPIADWCGQFGWGYDGVALFAPTRHYGTPDDFRAFVDRAHAVGIGVLLDVVYNHFGPRGCVLSEFSADYFTDLHKTEWGTAINFDGPNAAAVREFFLANACYWIAEFHLDGYRIDATQAFHDESPDHILAAVTRQARQAAGGRNVLVLAESEPQDARLIRPVERGGQGMDAAWNDDFHHSAHVRLTGQHDAYFSDYRGTADELVALAKWGYLFQGQRHQWQQKPRGQPALDLAPPAFINYLQNHDQVANTGFGTRIHDLCSPEKLRAVTALWLLMPQTPLIFQGQEFRASTPFMYFSDSPPESAAEIAAGRAKFLAQFPHLALPEVQHLLPDPSLAETFRACKLDLTQRQSHAAIYRLYRDLLALRRTDAAILSAERGNFDAAALTRDALLIRYFRPDGTDRLILANLASDLHLDPAPQPLLAPPLACHWQLTWTSEALQYGGRGTPEPQTDQNWRLPADTTLLLIASTAD